MGITFALKGQPPFKASLIWTVDRRPRGRGGNCPAAIWEAGGGPIAIDLLHPARGCSLVKDEGLACHSKGTKAAHGVHAEAGVLRGILPSELVCGCWSPKAGRMMATAPVKDAGGGPTWGGRFDDGKIASSFTLSWRQGSCRRPISTQTRVGVLPGMAYRRCSCEGTGNHFADWVALRRHAHTVHSS